MATVLKIRIRGVEFDLTAPQLRFVPRNFFRDCATGTLPILPEDPHHIHTLQVDGHPEAFPYVRRYLSGHKIFPLPPSAPRHTGLSERTLLRYILEDATGWRMYELAGEALAELRAKDALHVPSTYGFGCAGSCGGFEAGEPSHIPIPQAVPRAKLQTTPRAASQHAPRAASRITPQVASHATPPPIEGEIYKLQSIKHQHQSERMRMQHDSQVKQLEIDDKARRLAVQEKASAQIAAAQAQRDIAQLNMVTTIQKPRQSIWKRLRPCSTAVARTGRSVFERRLLLATAKPAGNLRRCVNQLPRQRNDHTEVRHEAVSSTLLPAVSLNPGSRNVSSTQLASRPDQHHQPRTTNRGSLFVGEPLPDNYIHTPRHSWVDMRPAARRFPITPPGTSPNDAGQPTPRFEIRPSRIFAKRKDGADGITDLAETLDKTTSGSADTMPAQHPQYSSTISTQEASRPEMADSSSGCVRLPPQHLGDEGDSSQTEIAFNDYHLQHDILVRCLSDPAAVSTTVSPFTLAASRAAVAESGRLGSRSLPRNVGVVHRRSCQPVDSASS